jgi:hypothetical protein
MAEAFMKKKIDSLRKDAKKDSNDNSNKSTKRKTVTSPVGRDNRNNPEEDGMVSSLRAKVNLLEKDVKRRQESYVMRERRDKEEIDGLQRELHALKSGKKQIIGGEKRMQIVKEMHAQIMKNVDNVQTTTSRILQEQERDLLRAFRARLFDVQNELEKEKNKSEEGASLWIEKNRQLEKDLEWAKEMADRLERVNQQLTQDNATLKAQFKTQEDDREFLIKELVAVRKDNERLRQEAQRMAEENETLTKEVKEKQMYSTASSTNIMSSGNNIDQKNDNGTSGSGFDEAKYKNIITRMKSLLERERKNLRRARMQYEREIHERTALEALLRECVNDVRNEIGKRRADLIESSNQGSRPNSRSSGRSSRPQSRESRNSMQDVPLSEFTVADRERVMELLLSQERVISLLYSKTFPVKSKNGSRPNSANILGGKLPKV